MPFLIVSLWAQLAAFLSAAVVLPILAIQDKRSLSVSTVMLGVLVVLLLCAAVLDVQLAGIAVALLGLLVMLYALHARWGDCVAVLLGLALPVPMLLALAVYVGTSGRSQKTVPFYWRFTIIFLPFAVGWLALQALL